VAGLTQTQTGLLNVRPFAFTVPDEYETAAIFYFPPIVVDLVKNNKKILSCLR
jgi:hypothetical protein